MGLKRKIGTLAAGVLVAASGVVATTSVVAAPVAQAGTVHNMYECRPSTGWCYQTNPPYNPNFKRACRWNYTIPTFSGGMYYTGCTEGYWRPEVH